jgi:hypothetical protein
LRLPQESDSCVGVHLQCLRGCGKRGFALLRFGLGDREAVCQQRSHLIVRPISPNQPCEFRVHGPRRQDFFERLCLTVSHGDLRVGERLKRPLCNACRRKHDGGSAEGEPGDAKERRVGNAPKRSRLIVGPACESEDGEE